ncbi:MAG: RluA family pseudouridine synthase [Bacillota bacterium]|uniref:Pseudouridine synthase n=1 Tax=Thermanaerosceptrum fracticalcis TaxID=1712410 RepID=A0A7G6E770_THEFR|nr:RluA family pseudouridine synthase [Thermanaerosceptrum fracticalcis]QNB47924.1 RluA family pseudouridine synthase [Thermanaerosceptrum fracticalcis]
MDSGLIQFVVESDREEMALGDYLHNVKHISAKALTRLKHHGQVLVNNELFLLKDRIKAGDRISLIYPPQHASEYLQPEYLPFNIIYEDQDVLVVNKEAGLCVHPTKGHPCGTLANGILYHWEAKGERAYVHFVNRLDKDTSGLVLVAKHTYSAQQLFRQQRKGMISRRYLGLVKGVITEKSGTINLPIGRLPGKTTKRIISPEGLPAVTHFQVVEIINGYTLLKLTLETGRTHQIRVHLSHLGYPLVGDELYGGESFLARRQLLHAFCLTFTHPRSGEELKFSVPWPKDMDHIINKLKNNIMK